MVPVLIFSVIVGAAAYTAELDNKMKEISEELAVESAADRKYNGKI